MSKRLIFIKNPNGLSVKEMVEMDNSYSNGFGKWFTANILRPIQGTVGNVLGETGKFLKDPKKAVQKSWNYNTTQIKKSANFYAKEMEKSWNYNSKKLGEAGQKIINIARKIFPVTFLMRQGFLAALELNLFNMAGKLRVATLSPEEAKKAGVSEEAVKNAQPHYEKVWRLFRDIGGQKKWMNGAIKDGARKTITKMNKNNTLSANGINSNDWFIDYGENPIGHYRYSGEPVSTTSIATAMPMILQVVQLIGSIATTVGSVVGVVELTKKKNPTQEETMGTNPPTQDDAAEALVAQIANNPDLTDDEKAQLVALIGTVGVMEVAKLMTTKTELAQAAAADKASNNNILIWGGIGLGVAVIAAVIIVVIKKRKNKNN